MDALVLDGGRIVVNEDADAVEVEPVLTSEEADHRAGEVRVGIVTSGGREAVLTDEARVLHVHGLVHQLAVVHDDLVNVAGLGTQTLVARIHWARPLAWRHRGRGRVLRDITVNVEARPRSGDRPLTIWGGVN